MINWVCNRYYSTNYREHAINSIYLSWRYHCTLFSLTQILKTHSVHIFAYEMVTLDAFKTFTERNSMQDKIRIQCKSIISIHSDKGIVYSCKKPVTLRDVNTPSVICSHVEPLNWRHFINTLLFCRSRRRVLHLFCVLEKTWGKKSSFSSIVFGAKWNVWFWCCVILMHILWSWLISRI